VWKEKQSFEGKKRKKRNKWLKKKDFKAEEELKDS
jgi:hypothetical protein